MKLPDSKQDEKKAVTTVYKVIVLTFIAMVYLLIFLKFMFF